jgi:Spy/CpxP family protein refolding chaperone
MPKRILAACLVGALAALTASAQNGSTSSGTEQIVANMVARLTKQLALSSEQQAQATTIFTTEQNAIANLRSSMQTAQKTLQTAIMSNDSAVIGTQSTQIGSLTGEQVLAQATASAAFYAVLTPEQQAKYKALPPLGREARVAGGSH